MANEVMSNPLLPSTGYSGTFMSFSHEKCLFSTRWQKSSTRAEHVFHVISMSENEKCRSSLK